MITWREVGYDILTNLKQSFADKDITLNQVYYWLKIYGDRLLSQHIQKHDTQAYLQVFNQVPVLTEVPTGRKYIELPVSILDFDQDKGVDFISYDYTVETNPFTHVTFTRTTMSESKRLYWTSEEEPKPDNAYWYRANNPKIYLLGIECINVKFVELGLIVSMSEIPCDLSQPIPLPTELISVLQRQVLDLGRFVLQMPVDRINDGDYDALGKVPNTKLVSVNEQPQTE